MHFKKEKKAHTEQNFVNENFNRIFFVINFS